MHVVALTRLLRPVAPGGYRTLAQEPEPDLETTLLALAPLLGCTALDARMRLAGGPPWPVARFAEQAPAEALLRALRSAGLGAVSASTPLPLLRDGKGTLLRLLPEGLRVEPQGTLFPWERTRALLRATVELERQREEVERVVVPSAGRGAQRTVEVSRYHTEREAQQALYLFAELEQPALRLTQEHARSPEVQGLTQRARWESLVVALRERCLRARYDESLALSPRKRTSFTATPLEGASREARSSNQAETDLAAFLLARALLEGER